MDKRSYELIGSPCGHHGQYTFYKAIRLTTQRESIVAIGDFFFVRIWQDSELVSIGELQLLWTDRVSDQTLVSLRLYFLPENTPDGRNLHGQDEVLAINDKVVVRAEDLLSWMCDGSDWRWGLRAVWRGACTPPADPRTTQPLHHTKLDFADVEKEKNAIVDPESPGVVVFSYPRYCRYRALLSRLEGIQADWLRDSLVAALGGYAAPTKNTRILYCKDTFEYPELEGNEFVCNHLAPKLKGRPRGRRRRRARSRSHSPSSRSSDSDVKEDIKEMPRVTTSRRLSLRNGAPERERKSEEDEEEDSLKKSETTSEDRAFLQQLKNFYKERNESVKIVNSLNVSLRRLYTSVVSRGGYEAVCRHKLWRSLHTIHPSSPPLALPTPDQPARARRVYERYLLPFETYERRNGLKLKISNGRTEPTTIDTIDVTDSPLREDTTNTLDIKHNTLRTPSPKPEKELSIDQETGEPQKDELNIIVKPAEELNREFLESLPKEDEKFKITIKPVEKLIDNNVMSIISFLQNVDVVKLFEDNCVLINELVVKHNLTDSSKVIDEVGRKQVSDASAMFLKELAQKLNLGNIEYGQQIGLSEGHRQVLVGEGQLGQAPSSEGQGQLGALQSLSTLGDKYAVNGHTSVSVSTHTNTEQKVRPAGRSSLRAVRVKPTRQPHAQTPPIPPVRSDSSGSPPSIPPLNNFGIHRPPSQPTTQNNNSDDEIVEVPYKPKTPEIIDLDEYPESPQGVKKKKLDILKERGLEVTAIPTAPAWGTIPPVINPIAPLIPNQMILNPAVQHQIMTQAQLFQMYNIIPPNYANGIQPPKVIQATSAFGSSGPEKTVYGNPKDPFMPPPHVLLGTPIKPLRTVQSTPTPPQDILDLTCKNPNESPQKPAVEIVRIPTVPSPKTPTPQNLSKNYTLIDGKAVVGSNLEITLVNPKNQTPPKNRQPQKRSSNGKFVSAKTPTPPKDYPKSCAAPTPPKKPPIIVPNYQINRDDVSPTSSTGSRDSQSSNFMKNPNSLAQMMDMQKSAVPSLNPFIDPIYMSALYSSLTGQVDQRQLAVYRDLMANQVRGYSGLLNMGVATPTTKN